MRVDAHTLSLIVDSGVPAYTTATVDRRARVDRPAGSVVHVGAVPVAVTVNGGAVGAGNGDGGAAGSGPLRIVAPMPGKVVRVLVKAGDAVRARQPVVVVEAMKMENELRADRDGTVAEIHAREGMSVEAGALLDRDSVNAVQTTRAFERALRYVSVGLMARRGDPRRRDRRVADGRSRAGRAGAARRREGSKYIERPMQIGRLSIHLLTGKYVVEDLIIDGLRPGDRPFFTAKRIAVAIDWATGDAAGSPSS